MFMSDSVRRSQANQDKAMTTTVHTIRMGLSLAYLIQRQSGLFLVDAGTPRKERMVLRKMHALRRNDLKLIFITHAHLDHYGSAAALRRLTGAPIAIHHLDAPSMAMGKTLIGSTRSRGWITRLFLPLFELFEHPEPTPADLLVEDGEDLRAFGLDATVIHTPGHTPGSSSLIVERKLAFVGDLLTTRGRPHVQQLYAHDWSNIPRSLRRLQALEPEWVYTGHGVRPLSGAELQKLSVHHA
jgi:hydroxyacylglutathione hydrolase